MSYLKILKKGKKSYEGEGILLKLTREGREELESRRFGVNGWDRGADQILCDLLEDHLCNGWEFIQPEEIGALTSANIISDEVTRDEDGNITKLGKIYWFPDYAIRLEINELADTGEVFFPAAKEVTANA